MIPRISALALGLAAAALVAGCSSQPVAPVEPAFYQRLDQPGRRLDPASSYAMINLYRQNNGALPLQPDAALTAIAERAAERMASENRVIAEEELALSGAFQASGLRVRTFSTNLSAGYRTFAEAFSGWREAKAQNAHMLNGAQTRAGLAIAYRPGSKYQIFWVLIVAEPA